MSHFTSRFVSSVSDLPAAGKQARMLIACMLAMSLFANPAAAQTRLGTAEIYMNHLAGAQGEGVILRMPRYQLPPGLQDMTDFVPMIRINLIDGQGNHIATTDDREYPPSGMTIRFETVEVGGESASVLIDHIPWGGDIPILSPGRVEYLAELLIFVRPVIVQEAVVIPTDDNPPGRLFYAVSDDVQATTINLATGATVAHFPPGKITQIRLYVLEREP